MANIKPQAESSNNRFQQFSTGIYSKVGNTIRNGSVTYMLCTRKQITPSKPPVFLLQLKPFKQYISSLYRLSEYQYTFDFKGNKYTLKLNEQKAEILLTP